MIQIIKENLKPSKTSFSEKLNLGVGKGLEHASDYMMKREAEKRIEQENRQLKELTGLDFSGIKDPKMREKGFEFAMQDKQKAKDFSRQLEEQEKAAALKKAGESQAEMDRFNREQELLRQEYDYKERNQKSKPPKPVDTSKQDKEIADKKAITDTAQNSFNTMAKILKNNNLGRGSGIMSMFGGETSKDTGKFLSATAGLEAMLVDMVSRGTLSNARFQYITETILPKPTDPQAEIEGKMEALAELLGLDASELMGDKKNEQKSSGSERIIVNKKTGQRMKSNGKEWVPL